MSTESGRPSSPTLWAGLTEALIYFAILFGPWAFGTTQPWSRAVMNGVGFLLGALWLVQVLRPGAPRSSLASTRGRLLLGATLLVLLYCAVSVWNARGSYVAAWRMDYHPAATWLPHSYDRATSLEFFWQALGLAGLFWAVREWVLGGPSLPGGGLATHSRLRRLFWVLAINGLLLAVQGIIQRADGGSRLLWLVEPRINNTAASQFGPYAYRSNAAQYFNLLWPAVLAGWLAVATRAREVRGRHRFGFLLPCVALMAVCPFISLSRAAAVILVINMTLAGFIVWLAFRRTSRGATWAVLGMMAAVLAAGVPLGWTALKTRLDQIESGYVGRQTLYTVGWEMAADAQPTGLGPGSFSHLYQYYRRSNTDAWPAQMHNDWLEMFITFGWVGSVLVLLPLVLVVGGCFAPSGIGVGPPVVALFWVALMGCLLHAWVDFPFQIHSIRALFILLCAVLSCLVLSREKARR